MEWEYYLFLQTVVFQTVIVWRVTLYAMYYSKQVN